MVNKLHFFAGFPCASYKISIFLRTCPAENVIICRSGARYGTDSIPLFNCGTEWNGTVSPRILSRARTACRHQRTHIMRPLEVGCRDEVQRGRRSSLSRCRMCAPVVTAMGAHKNSLDSPVRLFPERGWYQRAGRGLRKDARGLTPLFPCNCPSRQTNKRETRRGSGDGALGRNAAPVGVPPGVPAAADR